MAGSQRDFLQAPSDAGQTSGEAYGGCGPAFLDHHEGGRRGSLPHLCRGQIPGRLHQIIRRSKVFFVLFFRKEMLFLAIVFHLLLS